MIENWEAEIPVGGRLWFAEEKRPYTVQARSARYLVCNKPFAARRTTLYCIVDLVDRVRGPENLIFVMGAETREQCEEMLARLERPDPDDPKEFWNERTEVSWRHRVPLDVRRAEWMTVLGAA